MRERKLVSISVVFATFICLSLGCTIVDLPVWFMPIEVSVVDIRPAGEVIFRRGYSNIEGINTINNGGPTILGGPYYDVSLENSELVVRTNAAFPQYEEVEFSSRVIITMIFDCTGGGTSPQLTIWINVQDTNNNAPEFIPTSELEFVVTPPLPPGFLITGCFSDVITVRDIDLTTSAIDFTIEDNPYFEIEYDAVASELAHKEFVAQLRTKTFIRSLSEPLILTMTATDVDSTGDPPLTTTGIVRIVADAEFQFPEELVFDQTFYLADYTDDHQLNLLRNISLRQGFDEYVNFTLEGDYYDHFDLKAENNQVWLEVQRHLPIEAWSENQIILVVRAEREFTSGASTTVIVQLPKEIELLFDRVFYDGIIVNNDLQLAPLVLSQGYEGVTVSAVALGEHSSHFTATVESNLVTLTMIPLSDNVIDDNSFISVEVEASTDRSSASTVVNLEIIKDDSNTPMFDKFVYSGSYDPATGLTAEQIRFVQGFDDTVSIDLIGEHADLFEIVEIGPVMTISSSTIPPELFSEGNIFITIHAIKPRTVGANAAIHIALPAARELEFEESTYRGSIEDGLLRITTIWLHQGYEEGVNFDLSGEFSEYFIATNERDLVTISISPSASLPDIAIAQNSIIMLTLTASGLNAVTTTTNVLLEVIKEDTTTPVFSKPIYYGTYSEGAIEIEHIELTQGFDNVSFRIDGEHAQYFQVSDNAVISLELPIPEDEIFSEKVLLFTIFADKALTVGANAAVLIRFPAELTESAIMRFSQHTYFGALKEDEFEVDEIVLDTGFAPGTEFIISGEYGDYFSWSNTNNVIQISTLNTLPTEELVEKDFIVIELEARRPRAVSVWTSVVIDIVKQEVIAPVFDQAYYIGSYTVETGLTFEETIRLSDGYDETVTLELTGEPEAWFSIEQVGEDWTLVSLISVPEDVLESNNQLLFTIVANKPNTTSGIAVISLDLPKEGPVMLGFNQVTYFGYIENDQANIPPITLREGFSEHVEFALHGELKDHFTVTHVGPVVTVSLPDAIPEQLIPSNRIILLEIEASAPGAVTAFATIVVEYIVDENISPVVELIFAQTFYSGSFAGATGLSFPTAISLTQGYDSDVDFALEGDDAEWFELVQDENSVTLRLSDVIPPAVIANNQELVFVVTAQSPGSATARTTVRIALVDSFPEGSELLGFNQVTYFGYIENDQANIPPITLREGFSEHVEFALHGELKDHFTVTHVGPVVTVSLPDAIPEQLIPSNRIILLEIEASAPGAVTAFATVVVEYIVDENISPVVELIFAQTFYSGSFAGATGLSFPTAISLTQGYDSDVDFALEGDDAEWFELVQDENSVTLRLSDVIPPAVIANNQELVFVVTAQSPGSATARTTVRIALVDSFPEGSELLGFNQVTYFGYIENDQANIPPITLREGFSEHVEFALHGELKDHFTVTHVGPVVTVSLPDAIPEQLIPSNRIILLEIEASAPGAVTAFATVVVEYIVDENISPVVELIFAQTFYSGSFAGATGLSFPTAISLTQGYDSDVDFALEGDDAEWFELVQDENSVTLRLSDVIPPAVIANNQELVFVVTAQSPGSATARTTVRIALVDSFPEGSELLGFNQVTYFGYIENDQANIPPITLREGFSEHVEFALHGELKDHFTVTHVGPVVTVSLPDAIPEQLIPSNRIILLEIEASAPGAVTAFATVVVEYIVDENISPVVELIFAQTFYSGSFAGATGLSFPTAISLTQGYDSDVDFALEGDDAEWFELVQDENSVTLRLSDVIPPAVIANNQELVFVVTAQSPGSATARTTVRIALVDSFPEGSELLGFNQVTYFGYIENDQANIPPITLREGFSEHVEFALHGELKDHFTVTHVGPVVTVSLPDAIPEQLIPSNRIILLEIEASAPGAVTAFATVVVEYIVDENISPVVELIFAQTFYSGSFAGATGLSFPTAISLTQGYDSDVDFALEGDDAEWFELVQDENSVTLRLSDVIPPAVIANNQELVFVVTAQSPGSATARTTVRIALVDSFPEGSELLGFNQVTYFGYIENDQANIPPITLREGFSEHVEFALHGELKDHFTVTHVGPVVTVSLPDAIPEQLIPSNRIILLEIEASAPGAVTAFATVVVEYIVDENISQVVELIFAQTFYSGSFAGATGLSFPTAISLTQGYDSDVDFALEGDDAEWFELVQDENSVTLRLSDVIPPAVIANNQELVFVVTAQSPGSATARTTVRIALVDSFPEGSELLGFNQVTYFGYIDNDQANIPPITLLEGFSEHVEFALHGELKDHFTVTHVGPVVTVSLPDAIPEQLIPSNRIILLEIEASAPGAVTAFATVVVEYIVDENISPVVELIFAQTFYSGSFAGATGLSFPTAISLTQGYDSDVDFALEGDDAEWFELVQDENSVTLRLSDVIPPAVIANNQELVFVVTAQSPGSATARTTVRIALVDSFPEGSELLGFNQVTYFGYIENDQANIPPITLREGFSEHVEFALHGELKDHFTVTHVGPVVTVSLPDAIPEQLIPSNRIILLEIEASAPGAVTAFATVVVEYIVDENISPVVELIFAQTFYSGSFAGATGLSFPTAISLTQGYDSDVDFALEGDDAEWFELVQDENSVTLRLSDVIPPAVIANNQELVFVVTAQSPGSATARTTVRIALVDSFPEGSELLGFNQVTYFGYIENDQANIPPITLREGFSEHVEFALHGELKDHFTVTHVGPVVTVSLPDAIPEQLIPSNRIILLEIEASAPGAVTAFATVVVEYIVDENISPVVELIFAQTFYSGSFAGATGLSFPTAISLTQGYDSDVDFALEGDDAEWFELVQDENSVTFRLSDVIPPAVIANNQELVFVVTAQSPGSATARTTVRIALVDSFPEGSELLGFNQVTYFGYIENDQANIPPITLREGFSEHVEFALHGELKDHFTVTHVGPVVTVSLPDAIPEQLIPSNRIILLEIEASAPGAVTAFATVVVEYIVDDNISPVVELIFAQTFYSGSFAGATGLSFPTAISLTQGYDSDVDFALEGDDAEWFELVQDENSVTLRLSDVIPPAVIANNQELVFVVTAQSPGSATARTTVRIALVDSFPEGSELLGFNQVTYFGYIENDQANIPPITLREGFSEHVEFALHGELKDHFTVTHVGPVVTVSLPDAIPEQLIPSNRIILLEIEASAPGAVTAFATVVVEYIVDENISPVVELIFAQTFYSGSLTGATDLSFPTAISLTQGYDSDVDFGLEGDDAEWFELMQDENSVTLRLSDVIPPAVIANNQQLVFVVTAQSPVSATARAVVIISISDDGLPTPTVTFSALSYAVRVDVSQTGLVGQVQATADNGEDVNYSLQMDDAQLQERLSINSQGELHLSDSLSTGFYTFTVVATTVITQIPGTAVVHILAEAVTVCGGEFVIDPLIILDVDEEEPHYDLINGTQYDNCHFTLTNRWPLDQTWVYVDEKGLHTKEIDREHASIAFMALSQIQVEVILHCEGDPTRTKRSMVSDALGPYDYGSNKWILTDTIHYNSRRSLVNIIVNDINDNYPIFVGKENEPIAVGYPFPELAERVLPRSLAELQATDADIGENAALLYWSSTEQLAVASTTGFVHVRNGATLVNGAVLTVNATDRNGAGLTGSINILVRLLDESYIAVVTVRDAFLDDEETVLSSISQAVGYEIKVLRSVVVSDEVDTEVSRKKRDVTSATGASLQLYVYGLIAREPVPVERLTADISSIVTAAVTVASSISLQDHLDGQQICVIAGRDTGLFVATIVLSVLLFIVLVLIAVWFFLRWRKNRNYNEFSDENSLASRNESVDKFPKPEVLPKPRLDIAELKKSERRLQEMLDAPIEEISVQPTSSKNDAILNMSDQMMQSSRNEALIKMPEPMVPIVIQSIDKLKDAADDSEDEFGEVKSRRKSVVTFNENVEKIIHVEDNPDNEDLDSETNYEVYKL